MRAESCRPQLAWWLLLATVLLLPFGVAAEIPVLLGAIAGIVAGLRGRIDWSAPVVRLALLLGVGYWLPQLVSAFDSLAPSKSWSEVGLDLRFVLFLLYVASRRWTGTEARGLVMGIAAIVLLWTLDGLVQAASGWSLGGPMGADRLSGIFGAGNLKLGGVLAVLAPVLLWQVWRWRGLPALLLASVLLLPVILLSGARAAWLGYGLAVVLVHWLALGWRRAGLALAGLTVVAILIGALAYAGSERFAERVERTVAAASVQADGIDHALTGRTQIWAAAWRMGLAHPVNGVGVRAFRVAYPDFANADDHFLANAEQVLHAHQWLLELWSETGVAGLAIWLVMLAGALRQLRRFDPRARQRALPATLALLVALFPLNTHYAVYSGFWGLLLVWLAALWLALLALDQS